MNFSCHICSNSIPEFILGIDALYMTDLLEKGMAKTRPYMESAITDHFNVPEWRDQASDRYNIFNLHIYKKDNFSNVKRLGMPKIFRGKGALTHDELERLINMPEELNLNRAHHWLNQQSKSATFQNTLSLMLYS